MVFLSGYAPEQLDLDGGLGPHRVLGKPFEPAELYAGPLDGP